MRTWVSLALIATSLGSPAYADDSADGESTGNITIRVRRLGEATDEPLLHLDTTPLSADAEGGLMDGKTTVLELGPRARLAVEGTWWQSGLSPSIFAEDLPYHGWRAAAELSYDLGPFSVGVNASLDRRGTVQHRALGLFAFRTFNLSRWMHAWIALGIVSEQWTDGTMRVNGTTAGITLGTTFR